jgi:tetratricopeptide (TPR) repeat protein
MDRKNPKPYRQLGVIYEEWGKYEEAVKFVKKRIELYNGDCDDYAHLGRLYDKMGKKEGAIAQY